MTPGDRTPSHAKPYRCHESTAEYLQFERTEELYEWYRSDLFRPYWVKFNTGYLRIAKSAGKGRLDRGPSVETTMKQISLGESYGKQRFSGDIIRTDNWSKEDWYAYVLYKIVHANTRNAEGLFFGKNDPDPTHRYKVARCALLNYIRYSNTSPREPIIPDSMAGDRSNDGTDKGMGDLPNIEGLTVIWKNCNDPVHGYPLDSDDTEDMYHVPLAFGLPTTAAIRNRIKNYFGFDEMGLEIARMFFQELSGDDITSTQMTNETWTRICSAVPGTRGRVYLLVETRNTAGRPVTQKGDNSLEDLPETSDVLDEDGDYRGDYINHTLDFTGTGDPAYTTMVEERGEAEWSLEYRICQYNALFDIACMTKAGNPNADVVWETEALTEIDVSEPAV